MELIDILHELSMDIKSTAITSTTISATAVANKYPNVHMYCFSLIEKASGQVAASTYGFSSGGIFEDYTMCTLIKDGRSCGSILNKLVVSNAKSTTL